MPRTSNSARVELLTSGVMPSMRLPPAFTQEVSCKIREERPSRLGMSTMTRL